MIIQQLIELQLQGDLKWCRAQSFPANLATSVALDERIRQHEVAARECVASVNKEGFERGAMEQWAEIRGRFVLAIRTLSAIGARGPELA